MLTRRSVLRGLLAAPIVVRAALLMPVKKMPEYNWIATWDTGIKAEMTEYYWMGTLLSRRTKVYDLKTMAIAEEYWTHMDVRIASA